MSFVQFPNDDTVPQIDEGVEFFLRHIHQALPIVIYTYIALLV